MDYYVPDIITMAIKAGTWVEDSGYYYCVFKGRYD
jgi:hypothetical protein